MITLELLTDTFGEKSKEHNEYLKNKWKGGANNAKGNSYENFYSIYQIAKSFNENSDYESTLFSSQLFGFIDDLLIAQTKNNREAFFQIKDDQTITWRTGKHPIETDFFNQSQVLQKKGVNSYLGLVVSNIDAHKRLTNSIPDRIKEIVNVIHFETGKSISSLIRNNSIFKEELSKMCALRNPSTDKLETLGTIILGAWDSTDKNEISLRYILDRCHQQNPTYIKGQQGDISNKLKIIFNSIEGFKFEIENGFITWEFNSTDSGVISYEITSKEFSQLENDIFNADIKTFEDLESFLSS